MFCTHIYQKTSINTIILGNAHITKPLYLKQLKLTKVTETISCACCTRTVTSLLLHPAAVLLSPIVLMLFAILETFILLSISLLLCIYTIYAHIILYFVAFSLQN